MTEPPPPTAQASRLIAVSNRLPVALKRERDCWRIRPGSGGLVTALAPVLRDRGGLWIGWPGTPEEADPEEILGVMKPASAEAGYELHPVMLTADDVAGFYYGFANEIIWPLFHDLQTRCNFDPDYWRSYLAVNDKFAAVTAEQSRESDFIWVHDYHLMHLAQSLADRGVRRRCGFFLHIPFPVADVFLKLPWRAEILRALLQYDLIGFQTVRDRRHFLDGLQYLWPELKIGGRRGGVQTIKLGEREVRVGAFPISIDFAGFAKQAASQRVADRAWYLHEAFPERRIILGVDRLDYTKGLPERLRAFGTALDRYPDLRRRVSLIQVVVPSREDVPAYKELKTRIEILVSQINGKYTEAGWIPIHYLYRSLDFEELLAFYRTAEVGLVTPLKDGMNLVAKEYCACNIDQNGVLILSEFAGAVSQLHRWAMVVNPHDVEGMAEVIHRAVNLAPDERRQRMVKLRESVKRHDIFWWVNTYLSAAFSKRLGDFPPVEEYVPMIERPNFCKVEGGGEA